MCIVYNVSVKCKCLDSLLRFFDSILWVDSLIRFLDSIPWFDSLIRFFDSILWFDSLIRYFGSIHWFDSLVRFIESIHWVDSLIRFICKCLASIVVYLRLASGWKISKKHEKEAERYVNGPQAENAKCKVVIFSREKTSWLHFCCVNFDFSENPRWILKQPLRLRAGWPRWPLHALCVFLCTSFFEPKWEP